MLADDPFKGSFALPGGFVDKDEDLDAAAARELKEETHVSDVPLTQFGAFGKPGRDPRGHTVTVAYYGALAASSLDSVQADDDAASAKWLPLADVPSSSFAFDHADVVKQGLKRMTEVRNHASCWTCNAPRITPAVTPLDPFAGPSGRARPG